MLRLRGYHHHMFDAHAHPGETICHEALICTASTDEYPMLLRYRYKALGTIPEGGRHPDFILLEEAASKGFSIGEIGLDRRFPDMESQKAVFRKALETAAAYSRFAVIHTVREYGAVYEMLREAGIKRFLLHGYTGSLEMAERFISIGGIISLSPRARKAKSFMQLLSLPFVTETDMKAGKDEAEALCAWNRELSELTGVDTGKRTEAIMKEVLP